MAQKLRMRIGTCELDVEGDDEFVKKYLELFRELLSKGDDNDKDVKGGLWAARESSHEMSQLTSEYEPAPSEFYRMFKPKSGPEILVILGKYLYDHRGVRVFTRSDVRSLAEEMRIPEVHPTNFQRAIQKGWLRETAEGFTLTLTGDSVLAELRVTDLSAA